MFYIVFVYTRQCFTMHFYIQNNVFNAFLYTKQCFTMHFIYKTMFYNAFLYTKQCFTMHFYTENNILLWISAFLLKNVLQCISNVIKECISIYKTMFYNVFLYTKQYFTMHFYIQKTIFYNAFLSTK